MPVTIRNENQTETPGSTPAISIHRLPLVSIQIACPRRPYKLVKGKCSPYVVAIITFKCATWVRGFLADPSCLTLSQEMCWNKISQVHNCTGWLARCRQALLEGVEPTCHWAWVLGQSSPSSTLNGTSRRDA